MSDMYAMGVADIDNVLMLLAASMDMDKKNRDIVTRKLIEGFDGALLPCFQNARADAICWRRSSESGRQRCFCAFFCCRCALIGELAWFEGWPISAESVVHHWRRRAEHLQERRHHHVMEPRTRVSSCSFILAGL